MFKYVTVVSYSDGDSVILLIRAATKPLAEKLARAFCGGNFTGKIASVEHFLISGDDEVEHVGTLHSLPPGKSEE